MFLRAAQPEDALEVAALHVRAWQATYRGLLFDDYLDALRPAEWAARYTFGDGDPSQPATVLAVEDDAIRGFATFGPCADVDARGYGELHALYVDPPSQGRGFGRALIAEARAQLAQQDFAAACLWVLGGNERAERFYISDGWTRDGRRRPAKVAGYSVEDIRYLRSL